MNDLATTHPHLAGEWHPGRNGTRTPDQVAPGSDRRAWWSCPRCRHTYQAAVKSRARQGTGCPVCAGRTVLPGVNDLATTHPALAGEWHPTRNVHRRPDQVSAGSQQRAWWACSRCAHEWDTSVANRAVHGSGCPRTLGTSSAPEVHVRYQIAAALDVTIPPPQEVPGTRWSPDIAIPATRVVVEYDGWAWHSGDLAAARDSHRHDQLTAVHQLTVIRLREQTTRPGTTPLPLTQPHDLAIPAPPDRRRRPQQWATWLHATCTAALTSVADAAPQHRDAANRYRDRSGPLPAAVTAADAELDEAHSARRRHQPAA